VSLMPLDFSDRPQNELHPVPKTPS